MFWEFLCYNIKSISIRPSSGQCCGNSTPGSCWAFLLVFVSQPCPLLTHLYGNSMFPWWFYQGLMGGEVHYFPASSTPWLNNLQGNCCLNTGKHKDMCFLSRLVGSLPAKHTSNWTSGELLLLHQDTNVFEVHVGGMCLGILPSCWPKKASLSSLTSMRKVVGMNSSIFSLL